MSLYTQTLGLLTCGSVSLTIGLMVFLLPENRRLDYTGPFAFFVGTGIICLGRALTLN